MTNKRFKTKLTSSSNIWDIKRKTQWKLTSEEKIHIVIEDLRGEENIAVPCQKEGIDPNLYYTLWQRFFMRKKQLYLYL